MKTNRKVYFGGAAHFKKCKQLFEYQHLLLLRNICGQRSNLYFNTCVNKTSVAAEDSCFPALVSNMCCSIVVKPMELGVAQFGQSKLLRQI
jgi:hypothetical protein